MNMKLTSRLCVAVLLPLFAACGGGGGGGGGGGSVPVKRTLTVTVLGTGTVSATINGVAVSEISNCSSTCSAEIDLGSVVILTETHDGAVSVFRGWAGSCTGSSAATCSVTLSQDRGEFAIFDPAASSGGLGDTFAITASNDLVSFNRSADPITALSKSPLEGVVAGDQMLAIDFRPANGVLYGVARSSSNNLRLYVINEVSARALQISILKNASGTPLAVPADAEMGMDFNAVTDTLWLSTDGKAIQVLELSSAAGTSVERAVDDGAAESSGLAFTNGFKGARSTRSFVINATALQELTVSGAAGSLNGVGAGLTISDRNGFDIDARNGEALIADNTGPTTPVLRKIDLETGVAAAAKAINNVDEEIRGLSIRPPKEARVIGICEGAAPQSDPDPSITATACVQGKTLIRFEATNPAAYTRIGEVFGSIGTGTILAMDVRPATGELIALGSDGNLHELDPITAETTLYRTLSADGADATSPFVSLDTTKLYGMDFNPMADRLRVVGRDAGETYNVNLLINPDTGAVTTQDVLQMTPFEISGLAHDWNPDSFEFYAIDSLSDQLYVMQADQDPLLGSVGGLTAVGKLNVDVTGVNGFDIVFNGGAGTDGTAYAAFTVGAATKSTLYTVNLNNGAATVADVTTGGSAIIGANVAGFDSKIVGLTHNQPTSPAPARFYAITAGINPRFIAFSDTRPDIFTFNDLIAGLQSEEKILGMDLGIAPVTGAQVIYALGSSKTLYSINPATAVATVVRAGLPIEDVTADFGVEFDASEDNSGESGRVQIISSKGEHVRVNPTPLTGGAATQDPPTRGNPDVHTAAYTNSYPLATSTKLHVFDQGANQDNMMEQGPATGFLEYSSAALGANSNATAPSAFDIIGGHNGLALFITQRAGLPSADTFSTVYSVDLATGAGTPLGAVGTAASPPTNRAERRIRLKAATLLFPTN